MLKNLLGGKSKNSGPLVVTLRLDEPSFERTTKISRKDDISTILDKLNTKILQSLQFKDRSYYKFEAISIIFASNNAHSMQQILDKFDKLDNKPKTLTINIIPLLSPDKEGYNDDDEEDLSHSGEDEQRFVYLSYNNDQKDCYLPTDLNDITEIWWYAWLKYLAKLYQFEYHKDSIQIYFGSDKVAVKQSDDLVAIFQDIDIDDVETIYIETIKNNKNDVNNDDDEEDEMDDQHEEKANDDMKLDPNKEVKIVEHKDDVTGKLRRAPPMDDKLDDKLDGKLIHIQENTDPFYIWCGIAMVNEYFEALQNEPFCICCVDDLTILDSADLDQICDTLNISDLKRNSFKQLVFKYRNLNDEQQQKYDELFTWCKDNNYLDLYIPIRRLEYESLEDILNLDGEELADLCSNLGLVFGAKAKFKRIIKTTKNESTTTGTPSVVSDTPNDSTYNVGFYNDLLTIFPEPIAKEAATKYPNNFDEARVYAFDLSNYGGQSSSGPSSGPSSSNPPSISQSNAISMPGSGYNNTGNPDQSHSYIPPLPQEQPPYITNESPSVHSEENNQVDPNININVNNNNNDDNRSQSSRASSKQSKPKSSKEDKAQRKRAKFCAANQDDPLFIWCVNNDVEDIYYSLRKKHGIDTLQALKSVTKQDRFKLCDEIGLKFGRKLKFEKQCDNINLNEPQKLQKQSKVLQGEGAKSSKKSKSSKSKSRSHLHSNSNLMGNNNMISDNASSHHSHHSHHSHSPQPYDQQQQQQYDAYNQYNDDIKDDPNVIKQNLQGMCRVPYTQRRTDKAEISGKPHKVLMVIGETGTGKSTLINSMMNYLFGVKHTNKYRYYLIEEEKNKASQAISQTDTISSYYVEPDIEEINYGLTLIDCPGFGDTRGVQYDKTIVDNIKQFFNTEISEINAVCFVVKSTATRLTTDQYYVFQSVLGIFGNDILNNIFILFTFCEPDKEPINAINALQSAKIDMSKYYTFNSAAFKSLNGSPSEWKFGMRNFKKFFKDLHGTNPVSLALTKDVLKQREALENYVMSLRPVVQSRLTLMQNLRIQEKQVKAMEGQINFSKDFQITVKEPKITKKNLKPGINTTTCIICNFTCHQNCYLKDDGSKRGCCAMDWHGNCKICPKKCGWKQHRNLPYIYIYEYIKKVITQKELESKYVSANSTLSKSQQIIQGTRKELNEKQQSVNRLISMVRECVNQLQKIALKPNTLDQGEYIQTLIDAETGERNEGWRERVDALQSLKENVELIKQSMSNDASQFDLMGNVDQNIQAQQSQNQQKKSWW